MADVGGGGGGLGLSNGGLKPPAAATDYTCPDLKFVCFSLLIPPVVCGRANMFPSFEPLR